MTLLRYDTIGAGPMRRLAALLGRDFLADDMPSTLPPLAHWLYFLPETPQSELGFDGHPTTDPLLQIAEPHRRMWAGGRVSFLAPIPIGSAATQSSAIVRTSEKHGRSGKLTFVTLRHEISVDGTVALVEEQDLVFRSVGGGSGPPATQDERTPTATTRHNLDTRALFRFSALTFNAHRIHFDRDYARLDEGYPDLVVHGPLQALLLVGHFRRAFPRATLRSFAFRGVRPLFVERPFQVNLIESDGPIALWTTDEAGVACMLAEALFDRVG